MQCVSYQSVLPSAARHHQSMSSGGSHSLIDPSIRLRMLFSSHEYSISTSSAAFRRQTRAFIHGWVYARGSSTVTVCWIVLASVRRNVFVSFSPLLCGCPVVSSLV